MAFQDITGARLGQVEMTTDYIAMYTCPSKYKDLHKRHEYLQYNSRSTYFLC
jgi:hypothetical protein